MNDPTYDRELIRAKPEWDLAFVLSEIENDRAPLGWGKYIGTAKCLLATFDVTRKPDKSVRVDASVPPGELHARQDGQTVGRVINLTEE